MQFNWNFLGRWTGNNASYDCGRVQSLLSLYVDSMTSRVERDAIETHLEGCESCHQQSECLRSIHQVVSSRPIAEPPSDLKMRIAQAIAAERAPARQAPRLRLSYGVLAGACSLLLCFVVAGERYSSYLAAQKLGTAPSKIVLAVNPVTPVVKPNTVKHVVKAPSAAHADTTKVATAAVPDKNSAAIPEGVRTHIRSGAVEGMSSTTLLSPGYVAPVRPSSIHVAVRPTPVVHPTPIVVHPTIVAVVHTAHTTPNHAAPPVVPLPHVDLPMPSPVTPTQTPAVTPTQPPVVVASAGTSNSSMTQNAALLGSVLQHIGQFKLRKGEAQIPFRAVDTAISTSTGTVDIVGSHFN